MPGYRTEWERQQDEQLDRDLSAYRRENAPYNPGDNVVTTIRNKSTGEVNQMIGSPNEVSEMMSVMMNKDRDWEQADIPESIGMGLDYGGATVPETVRRGQQKRHPGLRIENGVLYVPPPRRTPPITSSWADENRHRELPSRRARPPSYMRDEDWDNIVDGVLRRR